MDESQSNKSTPVEIEEAGVQFDPKVGSVSAWFRGKGSNLVTGIILCGFFALAFSSIANWEMMGAFAPILLIFSCIVSTVLGCMWIMGFHAPQPKVFSSTRTLSIQGLSEKALLKAGIPQALAQALTQRVLEDGQLKLPEPDAKVDIQSGKTIPFETGEKEKVIKEQIELETKVVEITSTAQIVAPDRKD